MAQNIASRIGRAHDRLVEIYFSAWIFGEHVKSHNKGNYLPGLIYLHFENKSYEVHHPEHKDLTSEQEPINKSLNHSANFTACFFTVCLVFVANIAGSLERACVIKN